MPRQARSGTPSASSRPIAFPPVRGTSLINSGQSACLTHPSLAGSFYCRQFYSPRSYSGGESIYPYYFPTGGYDSDNSAPPPANSDQDNQLAAQVEDLAAQVEMMREDQAGQASRDVPYPEPPMVTVEKPPTTLFVYRDGHQMEVQNYAILGKTLWVFSGQTTRRVPLADLDLSATQRVNEERGVDFVAPDPQ